MEKSQFLSLALAIAGKLYDETVPAAPPVVVVKPVDERDRLTAQRQAFLDAAGSVGQFAAFADVIANAHMNDASFADQYAFWLTRVASSQAELAEANKPYADMGDAWKSVVAAEVDDIDRNFNKLGYPEKFIYLGAVAPNRPVHYFQGDIGKLVRDAFSSPLQAGWTKAERVALRCDDLPYTGDASIVQPIMDRTYYMLVLRKTGPAPYQLDNFKLPFGGLNLHDHGG